MNILYNNFRCFGCLFYLLLVVSPAYAADVFPDLFDEQRDLYTASNDKATYRLTLSPIKKINSEWLAEREETITGKLNRRTIQVEHQVSLKDLWLQIQDYFENKNATVIYECKGLDCGSSNAWANTRFEVKQLYGLDVSQYYQVWELRQGAAMSYAAVYMVERGDRRTYLQLDHIIPAKPREPLVASASVLAKYFYLKGQIEVPGLKFEQGNMTMSDAALQSLARALNEKPFKKLLVVGHDYQPGTVEQQKERSLEYAKAVAEKLISFDVNERRIEVEAVGSLAPKQGNSDLKARVVVVLR